MAANRAPASAGSAGGKAIDGVIASTGDQDGDNMSTSEGAGPSGAASSVSDARVQAALERIADSAGIDLNAMPEVLEDVYRRLNSALSDSSSNDSGLETAPGTQASSATNSQAGEAGPDAAWQGTVGTSG